jgi:hypothetical protein
MFNEFLTFDKWLIVSLLIWAITYLIGCFEFLTYWLFPTHKLDCNQDCNQGRNCNCKDIQNV